jgi:hypothetical protein
MGLKNILLSCGKLKIEEYSLQLYEIGDQRIFSSAVGK